MKKIALILTLFVLGQHVKAQDNDRVITTGVPFFFFFSDERSARMADVGGATTGDLFSQK